MDGNGWWDIGYRSVYGITYIFINFDCSFLIGGDGNIYEGRGWNIQGAHTGGFNTVGYGVCFMGDFTDHNPNEKAMVAYTTLMDCAVDTEKIVTDYQMFGHRQTKPEGGTECPGDYFYITIQSWPHWVSVKMCQK